MRPCSAFSAGVSGVLVGIGMVAAGWVAGAVWLLLLLVFAGRCWLSSAIQCYGAM